MSKTLLERHKEVSSDHYDLAIKSNIFQRYWHLKRFREVDKFIIPIFGSILDIGCHSALFTQRIKQKINAKKIYGIDISQQAVLRARQRIPEGYFQVADAQDLPFEDNVFDAVFCLEVLEHLDHPERVVSEIKRVLKKGGYGIILVPTDNLLFKLIWFLWNLKYRVWSHTHVHSFTDSKLEDLIEMNKLKITHSKTFNLGMLKLVKFLKP